MTSCALAAADPVELAGAEIPLVLEDADKALATGGEPLEETLFHLYNALKQTGGCLLMTAARPPARWALTLEDLRSRGASSPAVEIGQPDDALIEAVLVKLFIDRQLKVDPEVIRYLVPRMERSFAAAGRLVVAIDGVSLGQRRNITVPLVREVLGQ